MEVPDDAYSPSSSAHTTELGSRDGGWPRDCWASAPLLRGDRCVGSGWACVGLTLRDVGCRCGTARRLVCRVGGHRLSVMSIAEQPDEPRMRVLPPEEALRRAKPLPPRERL